MLENLDIISKFLESKLAKLLDPGITTYPFFVKFFYCDLSFHSKIGFVVLKSLLNGQEISISSTFLDELFYLNSKFYDATPSIQALQHAEDMFLISSSIYSPTQKLLTHYSLTVIKKDIAPFYR